MLQLDATKPIFISTLARVFSTEKQAQFAASSVYKYAPEESLPKLAETFVKVMTKRGEPFDGLIARVAFKLRIKYRIEHPMHTAVDAVKPILRYCKAPGTKFYASHVLSNHQAERFAIKWIFEEARAYKNKFGVPHLEQGLFEEVSAVLNGTSNCYKKRFWMHQNPN